MKTEKTTFRELQHQKAMRITSQLSGLRLLLGAPLDSDAFTTLEMRAAAHGISDIVRAIEEQAGDLQSSLENSWVDARAEIDAPSRDVTLVCLWDVLIGIKNRAEKQLESAPSSQVVTQ